MSRKSPYDKRALNLEDIGARAGVSRSTVSRVVNSDPNVSAATRAKVLHVIDEIGYTPNAAARALVTKRTQVIGVVIPQRLSTIFNEPYYFPALLHGIASVINARDYSMMLWVEEDQGDPRRFYERIIMNRLIDGLVIVSLSHKSAIIGQLSRVEIPIVFTERPPSGLEHHAYVTIDNIAAFQQIVQHLVRLGRKRIGTVSGDLTNPDAVERLIGYRNALGNAGIPYDSSIVADGNYSRQSGYLAARTLVTRGADAIVAANDQAALGVLDALGELRRRVPEQIAVTGFDDLPAAAHSTPPLTTVRQPVQERGARAARLLLDLIEGVEHETPHVLLPTELVIRMSCGAHLYSGTTRSFEEYTSFIDE